MKRCARCLLEKPLTAFSHKRDKNRPHGDGFQSRCKDCIRAIRGQSRRPTTLQEMFFTYVTPGDPNACWEWQGCKRHRQGYGMLCFSYHTHAAHRIAWELHYGSIPEGMCVCHRCDNPPCCNWKEHLFLGTPQDNVTDACLKGRRARKLTSDKVQEIRALYPIYTLDELAVRFHVSNPTIHGIIHRKYWRYVD
jgi:hypothetical protein